MLKEEEPMEIPDKKTIDKVRQKILEIRHKHLKALADEIKQLAVVITP